MTEILNIALGGFWQFVGVAIILGMVVNAPVIFARAIIKGINIQKHGDLACYQPSDDDD
jgi:hypothetical protein